MSTQSSKEIFEKELILTETEAYELALELKSQLRRGQILQADEKRLNLIVAGLGDKRGLLRRTFTESLGVIGQSALPLLKDALRKHSNVTVRRAAAKALKLIGDPSALPDLLEAVIKDDDPVVQGSSVGAIAIFGEVSVEPLISVLTNPDSNAMQCGLASWGLAFIGAKAPQALRKAAKSKHVATRAASIAALGELIHVFEDPIDQDLLTQALKDPSYEVRAEATIQLGKLEGKTWTQPLLLATLKDSNAVVRKNAALSLMKSGVKEVIDELKKISREETDAQVITILNLAIKKLNT